MATRAVKLCVDTGSLTSRQARLLRMHGGGNRQIYNWALGKVNAQQDWICSAALHHTGGNTVTASLLVRDKRWRATVLKNAPVDLQSVTKAALSRQFTIEKADPNSPLHWWSDGEVNRFAMSSALDALTAALDRFFKDTGGCRTRPRRKPRKDGRPHGWPRFKRSHDRADSFALFNLVTSGQDPWRIVGGAHRITVPSIGSLRVHQNTKRLRRLLQRGGIPKSARFVSAADRWYVTILVTIPDPTVVRPTRRQRAAGRVGVDVGVAAAATLSTGEKITNPRHTRRIAVKVARTQRIMARLYRPGRPQSRAYRRAHDRLRRLQHRAAVQRAGFLHETTKRLATGWAAVHIEDLNVAGMTASPAPKPDPDRDGAFLANGRAAKAGLNTSILDVGFGEFRRQLDYKTRWYGTQLVIIDRFYPSSKTCSSCGAVNTKLALQDRTYQCPCGLTLDRDHNAALNLAAYTPPSPADAGRRKTVPVTTPGASPPPTPVEDTEARNGPPVPYALVR